MKKSTILMCLLIITISCKNQLHIFVDNDKENKVDIKNNKYFLNAYNKVISGRFYVER